MPVIDPPSIMIAGFLLAIFCAAVFFVASRAFRDTIPGLAPWALACYLVVLASALFASRATAASPLSVIMSNSVLTGSFLLMLTGLREFAGHARNYRVLALAFFVNVLLFTLILNYVGAYPAGLAWLCLVNGTIFAACASAILGIRKAGAVERLTGGVFALAALVLFVRMLTVLYGYQVPSHLFDPVLLQRIYFSLFPFVIISANIGFMLMVDQRVRTMVVNLNANLESAVEKRTAELREEIVRRERLKHEMAQVVEEGRREIGQELHDNLGQRMAGLSLLTEALANRLKTVAPELYDQASAIERTASEAVLETRRLAHGLMPVVPGTKGLRSALAELAESVSLDGRLHCSFCADAPIEVDDEYAATHLFRIAQESVSNLIRHGHATEAAIRLSRADGRTTLSITDNGVGFSRRHDDQGGEHGLRIMAYRASLIGYDFRIESVPGSGTVIKVSEL